MNVSSAKMRRRRFGEKPSCVGYVTGTMGKVLDLFGRIKPEGRAMERRRFKPHQTPFEERLAIEGRRLKEEAEKLPPGNERDDLIRRARQAETASHLTEWLTSPGLASPK
jgi:hypothetical protein